MAAVDEARLRKHQMSEVEYDILPRNLTPKRRLKSVAFWVHENANISPFFLLSI